jgi:peptidoglycan/xylan/chitin deacetylase (PgdA/CDA1 family)
LWILQQGELFGAEYVHLKVVCVKAIALGYHDVVDGAPDPQMGPQRTAMHYKLDRRAFCNHLWSIRDQAAAARVGTIDGFRKWEGEVPVFLTIDDGALSSLTCVAGELEECGWRGHFFVTTDWIGRPGFLDERQIRELRGRGHVIGSHSCTHPARMSNLSREQLLQEWSVSCQRLSDIIGERVAVASVPDGYYTRKVAQAAAEASIEVLFTSEPTAATSVVDGCLVLGRYSIQRHTPAAISGAIAAGQWQPRWRQTLAWEARKAAKALTGESYFAIRRFLLSRGYQS